MENAILLVTQIQNGYRMEKPECAPNFIEEMMKNCWKKEPNDRPTFSQIADVIAKEIEYVVGIDYLNLNEPISGNGLIRKIIDPSSETNRLEIVKLINETANKSPSPITEITVSPTPSFEICHMNNRTDLL